MGFFPFEIKGQLVDSLHLYFEIQKNEVCFQVEQNGALSIWPNGGLI